ncbi:MAG: hypothetical protein WC716_16460 [Chitinophagaceae bacterium]|jgi:hypothetical protein
MNASTTPTNLTMPTITPDYLTKALKKNPFAPKVMIDVNAKQALGTPLQNSTGGSNMSKTQLFPTGETDSSQTLAQAGNINKLTKEASNAIMTGLTTPAGQIAKTQEALALDKLTKTQSTEKQQMQDILGQTGKFGTTAGFKAFGGLMTAQSGQKADVRREAQVAGMKEEEDRRNKAIDQALKLGETATTERGQTLDSETELTKTGIQETGATTRTGMQTGSSEKIANIQETGATTRTGMQTTSAERIATANNNTDLAIAKDRNWIDQQGINIQTASLMGYTDANGNHVAGTAENTATELGLKGKTVDAQFGELFGTDRDGNPIIGSDGQPVKGKMELLSGEDKRNAEKMYGYYQDLNGDGKPDTGDPKAFVRGELQLENDKVDIEKQGLKMGEAALYGYYKDLDGNGEPDVNNPEAFVKGSAEIAQGRFGLETKTYEDNRIELFGVDSNGNKVMGEDGKPLKGRFELLNDQDKREATALYGGTVKGADGKDIFVPGSMQLERDKVDIQQQGMNLEEAKIKGYYKDINNDGKIDATDKANPDAYVMGELSIAGKEIGLKEDSLELQKIELLGVDNEGNPVIGSDGKPMKGKLQIAIDTLENDMRQTTIQEDALQWDNIYKYAEILADGNPEMAGAMLANMFKGSDLEDKVPKIPDDKQITEFQTRATENGTTVEEEALKDNYLYVQPETRVPGKTTANPITIDLSTSPEAVLSAYGGYENGLGESSPFVDGDNVKFEQAMTVYNGTKNAGRSERYGVIPAGSYTVTTSVKNANYKDWPKNANYKDWPITMYTATDGTTYTVDTQTKEVTKGSNNGGIGSSIGSSIVNSINKAISNIK